MTVSETIVAAWASVKRDAASAPGLYERRVFSETRYSLFVAVSQPSGLGQLLFDVQKRAIRGRLQIETKGFTLRIEPQGNSPQVRICLEETHQGYGDLFRQLCEDAITAILPCANEELAVEAMRSRLGRWQRFMERAGVGLSDIQQVGLFGELLFLKRLLAAGCSGSTAVDGWRGPLGANQDFLFGVTAVEVKSTASNVDSKVSIANERQLDDTGTEALFLFHVSFDRREHASGTLPDLVNEIRSVLGDGLVSTFEDRLLAAGYHESQSGLYANFGYTERKSDYYLISSPFPRIIPKDLKTGVFEVQYCLELSAAAQYAVPEKSVFDKII